MTVDEAIEYLNELMEEQFDEFGYHKIATEGVRDLLKSLATRCQDYDALLDELKDTLFNSGDILALIKELEKKYLGGKK